MNRDETRSSTHDKKKFIIDSRALLNEQAARSLSLAWRVALHSLVFPTTSFFLLRTLGVGCFGVTSHHYFARGVFCSFVRHFAHFLIITFGAKETCSHDFAAR
jgi:hypothetical protein